MSNLILKGMNVKSYALATVGDLRGYLNPPAQGGSG